MGKELKLFGCILVISVLASFAIAFFGGRFKYSSLAEDVGMIAFQETAHNLVTSGSFGTQDNLFAGYFRRPPAYPILLATVYFIFGEYLWVVWGLHLVLWGFSLFVLWRVSRRFLDGLSALLPPLFFGLWWGASTNIFIMNPEVFAMLAVLLFVYFALCYGKDRSAKFLFLEGLALAVLILTKPIFLYFVPIALALQYFQYRVNFTRAVLYMLPVLVLVGSWSLYSYRVFGTYELASGALTIMRRADDVEMSGKRIRAFIVATFFGDFNADRLYPGYAADPEPVTKASVAREHDYLTKWERGKANEADLQRAVYAEAKNFILMHPLQYILLTPVYALRLHMPVNLRGEGMDHTFAGSSVPSYQNLKSLILGGIFLVWYAFIAAVFWNYVNRIKDWQSWGVILALIPYSVVMYALISHSEARYLLPVMPFYFLLFSTFVVSLYKRFWLASL